MGKGVTCKKVVLPNGLCTSCPLRPSNSKGQFIKCSDTYDTSSTPCLSKMREYVAANPCDPVRADAMSKLDADPEDTQALQTIDYFLYTVCEQCCDCVPMGANLDFFAQYNAAHSSSVPALYDPARGNCPAHAFYDICKILPDITHFSRPGDTSAGLSTPACGLLTKWFISPASKGWQDNPKTELEPELRAFLLNMLDVAQCAAESIWDTCFELESKQSHLGVPEENPPAVEEEPVITIVKPSKQPAPSTAPTKEPETPKTEEAAKSDAPTPPANPDGGESTPEKEEKPDTPDTPEGPNGDGRAVTGDGSIATVVPSAGAEPDAVPISCFPAYAEAELSDGSLVRMDELRIGDNVRVSTDAFSPIVLFTHRDALARTRQVHIKLADGKSITLSAGHYLPINGKLSAARDVTIGDKLAVDNDVVDVVHVNMQMANGLYNPHTAAGTIVVDGITCSTYTEAVPANTAHAILSPIRAAFLLGVVSENTAGSFLRYGAQTFL